MPKKKERDDRGKQLLNYYKDTNENLKAQIYQLQQDKEVLQDKLAKTVTDYSVQWKMQMQMQRAMDMERICQENHGFRQENERLHQRLHSFEKDYIKLSHEMRNVQKENLTLQNKGSKSNNELKLRSKLLELVEKVRQKRLENDAFINANNQLTEQIEGIRKRLKEKENELSSDYQAKAQVDVKNTELQKKVLELEQQLESAKAEIEKLKQKSAEENGSNHDSWDLIWKNSGSNKASIFFTALTEGGSIALSNIKRYNSVKNPVGWPGVNEKKDSDSKIEYEQECFANALG
jgi:chromosome segregation ATPase